MNKEENYFHAGDIIYLDIRQFTSWKNNDALMYVNFSDVSKEENSGQDINISTANETQYNPKIIDIEVEENIYAYVIGFEDEGETELRFWRGNATTLWNCSVVLTYEDYANGLNCIKINGWNNNGFTTVTEYNMDVKKDSDEDGLSDLQEVISTKTNPNNIDTDGDRLSDYDELEILFTDPLKGDTDGDGIEDGEEDYDGDGLTNKYEINCGSDPTVYDSDGDKLNDYDELYKYSTDIILMDTDADGVSDGKEVELGTDPLVYQSTFNIKTTVKNSDSVIPSVEIELTGKQVETLSINIVEDELLFPKTIPGYIGATYDFSVAGTFEEAVLSFQFDENL